MKITKSPLEGLKVLEVGSGRGGGAAYIAKYLNPAQIIGVDISTSAIALCKKNYTLSNLTFQQGDSERLPFEDNNFDAVELWFPYDEDPLIIKKASEKTGLPILCLNTIRGNIDKGEFGLSALPDKKEEAKKGKVEEKKSPTEKK